MRARLPPGSWRQFVVPAGIQVQFCHRLGAPIRTRPHTQSLRGHSTVFLRLGIGPAYFHGSWCPWGMRVLSQSSILGAKLKVGCRKINDLPVKTFLFSIICDRAIMPPRGTTMYVNGDGIAEIYKAAALTSQAPCATPVPHPWTSCTPECVRGCYPARQYGTDHPPSQPPGVRKTSQMPRGRGRQL